MKKCIDIYNRRNEAMYIKKAIEDFDDLENMCWNCDEVLEEIRKQEREDEAMEIIEEIFCDIKIPTETELNDFVRFDLENLMGL